MVQWSDEHEEQDDDYDCDGKNPEWTMTTVTITNPQTVYARACVINFNNRALHVLKLNKSIYTINKS